MSGISEILKIVSTCHRMSYGGMDKIGSSSRERRQTKTDNKEDGRQRVLDELCCIAFSRATDYVEIRDGKAVVKDTEGLEDAAARAVVSIREGTKGVEVKLGDKLRALELLGRCLGAFDKESDPGGAAGPRILDDIEEQEGC